jgi:bifunctional DNase/RNase
MTVLVAQDVIVRIRKGVRYPGPGVQRRVLLRERDGDRLVHLWAGADDGDFVALALAGQTPPTPTIYDVVVATWRAAGLSLKAVWLPNPDDPARLDLEGPAGSLTQAAAPIDAVNLALRCDAPLDMPADALAECGIPTAELWDTLLADEAAFAAELRDHLPPDMGVAFPGEDALEWRSIVPPEWRLYRRA